VKLPALPDLPALPIVPSAAAVAILLLIAPLALLLAAAAPGAWIVAPAAALALLGLALADGALAGRLVELKLTAPTDAEIGRDARLVVLAEIAGRASAAVPEAALGFDPRLGHAGVLRFPLAPALAPAGAENVFAGEAALHPVRRGTGALHDLWLRWPGPLGLAHRQVHRRLDQSVRVWPDLAPVRSPQLQAWLRDSRLGTVARRIRGEGSQFEALREYQPGIDRRRIDWKASARHTALYARENEAERDNQIVLALDCGQAMCEPVDGLPRIDRAVSAALTAAWVALKGGDRVALFGFADRPLAMTPFVTDTRAFARLQQAAAALDYVPREPNYTLALATLTAKLKRRSLIVLFSDFSDPTSAELMVESVERLVRHHLTIFVTMADTELDSIARAEPASVADMAAAVTADGLARQRALVLQRLRRLGVDVIEAPHQAIGFRLIDRYLEAKRLEAVG
jgi:uncharacterized protein (DUF58 family)